jgi:PAS domain S-box-containing protein
MNVIAENQRPNSPVSRSLLDGIIGSSLFRNVLGFCLFEVAFYFAYRAGMSFSPTCASPFWFPDAVLLCALLLAPTNRWWIFVLAPLPIRWFVAVPPDVPAWFLLATFATDSAKGLLTAAILRRYIRNPLRLETTGEFAVFGLIAVLLVPAVSAFGGAAARSALGYSYWLAWQQWFLGDALAHLIVTTAVLYWVLRFPRMLKGISIRRWAEGGLLASGLVLTSYLAFHAGPGTGPFADARSYVPVPFLFWAAIRFGMPGASGAIAVLAFFSVDAAIHGRGPFSGQSPGDTAFALQWFLLVRTVPLFLVAILIDQKRVMESSLRESEERYRGVVESQAELICRYLPDTTLTFVNEAYCRFFKRQRSQLIGHKFLELIPQSAHEAALRTIDTLCRHRTTLKVEHEVILPDGSIGWHQWTDSITKVVDGEVAEFQGIGQDITERKRAEEARQNLAHASRLALVGELTAMIAHEVNQPLGAILSNADAAEMLMDSKNPPLAEIRQILVDIRKNDLRASEAIIRIRTLLRKREMEMLPLDVNETVADVLRLVAGDAMRRRVHIQKELAPALPMIRGDQVHLQQVMLNLILNAMDATSGLPENRRRVFIRTARNGNNTIEVAVNDAGPGVPADKLHRVFESFYTTKREGMGLGLSIARSIIEAHHGRVWVENDPAGGASFRFTVPVLEEN